MPWHDVSHGIPFFNTLNASINPLRTDHAMARCESWYSILQYTTLAKCSSKSLAQTALQFHRPPVMPSVTEHLPGQAPSSYVSKKLLNWWTHLVTVLHKWLGFPKHISTQYLWTLLSNSIAYIDERILLWHVASRDKVQNDQYSQGTTSSILHVNDK
jgi:hypothetical protein